MPNFGLMAALAGRGARDVVASGRKRRIEDEVMATKKEEATRKRTLEDALRKQGVAQFDATMRDEGYIPEGEALPDGATKIEGQTIDAIIRAASPSSIRVPTEMPDVNVPSRYGSAAGGYRYDKMSTAARKERADLEKAERDAKEPYRVPANTDPLSPEGIRAAAERAAAVAKAEAPYRKDPNSASGAGKIPTEGERRAAGMSRRLQGVKPVLDSFDNRKTMDELAAKAGMLGNWATSAEGRRLRAAGKIWATSVLRPESGATITEDELDTYFEMYLPRPGDDEATLEFKRGQRAIAEEAVAVDMAGRAAPPRPDKPTGDHSKMTDEEFTAAWKAGKFRP